MGSGDLRSVWGRGQQARAPRGTTLLTDMSHSVSMSWTRSGRLGDHYQARMTEPKIRDDSRLRKTSASGKDSKLTESEKSVPKAPAWAGSYSSGHEPPDDRIPPVLAMSRRRKAWRCRALRRRGGTTLRHRSSGLTPRAIRSGSLRGSIGFPEQSVSSGT